MRQKKREIVPSKGYFENTGSMTSIYLNTSAGNYRRSIHQLRILGGASAGGCQQHLQTIPKNA